MVNRRVPFIIVLKAMFFGFPEHLTFLRYKVLSPQRRYVSYANERRPSWISESYLHDGCIIMYHI